MSQVIETTPATDARAAWLRISRIVWAGLACVLLAASGVYRGLQDSRHGDEKSYLEACPIDLQKIPDQLGGWRRVKGTEKSLDSLTMRISGGTDHVIRTYVDDQTGVSVLIMILFGPAEPVIPHTPEVCYPSNGFTPADDSYMRIIKGVDGRDYPFRSGVYTKAGGRSVIREESYYSFRLEGVWSPDAGAGRRFPRRNPSVFKIQVQRRVLEGERRDSDDPTEALLAVLAPELERMITEAESKASSGRPSISTASTAQVSQ
jgi:hypothetical protein